MRTSISGTISGSVSAGAIYLFLVSIAGCDRNKMSEATLDEQAALSEQPGEPPVESAKSTDQALEDTSDPSVRWMLFRKAVATIDDQVLERIDGAASIGFRLKNTGSEAILFESYEPYFVAGTYYTTPSGDRYTIEGDDRNIVIWFDPGWNRRQPSAAREIAPGEEKSFTATVSVPADMPNPVKVSVSLLGPFPEANTAKGGPRKLQWIERTGAESR